jgi:hypothetical protein
MELLKTMNQTGILFTDDDAETKIKTAACQPFRPGFLGVEALWDSGNCSFRLNIPINLSQHHLYGY